VGENTVSDIRPLSNGAVIYCTEDPIWVSLPPMAGPSVLACRRPPIFGAITKTSASPMTAHGWRFPKPTREEPPPHFSVLTGRSPVLQGGPIRPNCTPQNWTAARDRMGNSFRAKTQRQTDPTGSHEFSRCLAIGCGDRASSSARSSFRASPPPASSNGRPPRPVGAWGTNAALTTNSR